MGSTNKFRFSIMHGLHGRMSKEGRTFMTAVVFHVMIIILIDGLFSKTKQVVIEDQIFCRSLDHPLQPVKLQ